MAEHTFVDGDALTASQMNADLMHQAVIICTSSTRGTTWLGKHIFETDTELHRWWDGSRWVSQPMGIIAHATTNDNAAIVGSTIYAKVTGSLDLELQFDRVSGEMYAFHAFFSVQGSVVGDDFVYQPEINLSGSFSLFDVQRVVGIDNTGFPMGAGVRCVYTAGSSGTTKFKLGIARASGTGFGVIVDGSDFCVEHMGNFA